MNPPIRNTYVIRREIVSLFTKTQKTQKQERNVTQLQREAALSGPGVGTAMLCDIVNYPYLV
jgi:hypothetical protein